MPLVLAPLFAPVVGTGLILGTAANVLAANVIFAAASFGVQAGLSAYQRQEAKRNARRNQRSNDQQLTVRGSIQPRRRHYGKGMAAGVIVFIENIGSDVYFVLAVGTGTISSFEQFFVGDKAVLLDDDGCVTNAPFWVAVHANPNLRSYVRIHSRRGYAEQEAFDLIADAFPGKYTASCKLNGIAAIAARYRAASAARFPVVFNSTIPEIKALIEGAPVFDPREPDHEIDDPDTWEYSTNASLQLRDFLTNSDGQGRANTAIALDTFEAAAEVCDEFVPLKSGGSERRYRCATSYAFDESPVDIVERIAATCRGELYTDRHGKLAFRVGQWVEPEVTLGPDDIISINSLQRDLGLLRQFNVVRPVFTSPDHGYQEIEAAEVVDAASIALLGRKHVDDARLPAVPSHSQAQRLAKIELYEDNPPLSGEITCKATGMNIIGERVFRLDLPDEGIDIVARCTGLRIAGDLSSVTIAFEQLVPEAYAWDPATDEADAPAIPPETTDDATLPSAPTGFTFTTETDGTSATGIRWVTTLREGQVYDFRWRPVGGDWTVISDLDEPSYLLDPVTLTEDYDVGARVRTAQGGISAWGSASFTATDFVAVSLAAPTDLDAMGGQEAVEITVTQSADLDAWALQYTVYPAAGSPSWSGDDQIVATPGAALAIDVTGLTPGDYLVECRAISLLGSLTSSAIGPEAVTVTVLTGDPGTGTGGDSGAGGSGSTGGGDGDVSGGGAEAGGLY